MAKHNPNHDPFKEAKFIFPFVSPRISSETEHMVPPSLEPEPCPSSYQNIVLENKNLCAMDIPKAPTLETEKKDFAIEHEGLSFETPRISCLLLESPEFIVLSATCCYEEDNHPSLLVCKLFKMMVVDAFVYHKHFKSHSSTMALTLQLE